MGRGQGYMAYSIEIFGAPIISETGAIKFDVQLKLKVLALGWPITP